MTPRQAVILAGGQGKRLRPHTDTMPKPMVPVAGRAIIDHQLDWLATKGVTHAVVSCGYLAEVLIEHLAKRDHGPATIPAVERDPLGRGGGLKLAARHLPFPTEPWYALNGDVLTAFSLQAMASWHETQGATATIALARPPLPWGVAKTDTHGRVLAFEESPPAPATINAGVYVFAPHLVAWLPDRGDHERSTFPSLARQGRLYGYEIHAPWRAVDTEKDRSEAENTVNSSWPHRVNSRWASDPGTTRRWNAASMRTPQRSTMTPGVDMVTVGTWNVENLFLPGDGAGPASREAYETKLDALANTITSLHPDVLAVQEIGEAEALDDLLERLGAGWHRELADPDGRGIRVGFVSQVEMSDAEQVRAFPSQLAPIQVDDDGTRLHEMGRPALRVRVQSNGRTLDLVTYHLKSKLLTFPGGRFTPKDEDERARYAVYALNRRAAEAATVRAYATELLDGHGDNRGVIVMGDLNDEVHAATTQILLGPPGSEIGTNGYRRPDQGDGWRLWNLAPRIPEPQRFSRLYRGRPELIDHILVSRALVTTVGDGDVTTGALDIPSITDTPTARRGDPGSDHRPVIAHLDF